MQKSDFYYDLPVELIAQTPLPNRTASRLLCVDKQQGILADKHFTELINLLAPEDLLVFNDTKVIPARLFGHKATGGRIEILLERLLTEQTALAQVRASKSPKVGTLLQLEQGYRCEVVGRKADLFELRFIGNQSISQILDNIGHLPLPPYITRAAQAQDLARYQTVFARHSGAVAAPTAGLHFDTALLEALRAKEVHSAFVTLHVGSGTFQPVRVENLAEHKMHREYFVVPKTTVRAIEQTKARQGRVVAVGTTALRALESAASTGQLHAGMGDTDLFITPGYTFNVVDALVTNFHLPESTLLMLVSAFAGHASIMRAYQHAISQRYRFFSYGDAMFLY